MTYQKYYIAYDARTRTNPRLLKDAEVIAQDEDLATLEEILEEKGVRNAAIFEYDCVPNTEYLDGRMVLHELLLENERIVN